MNNERHERLKKLEAERKEKQEKINGHVKNIWREKDIATVTGEEPDQDYINKEIEEINRLIK